MPARSSRVKIDYWRIMAAMILGSLLFTIWTAPFWRIQSVDIRGTTPYTRKYLENFLQAHSLIGVHILRLNPMQLKQQILKNPLVQGAQFERELLPTRLTIKVQERKPDHLLYLVQGRPPQVDRSKPVVLDHEGVVLPLPPDVAPEQSVQLCVMPSLVKTRLPQPQLELLRELKAYAQQKLLPVEGVFDISRPQNLQLYLKQPKVTVWLGRSEDLQIKLKLIQPTLDTAKQDPERLDYLDLRFWKHPVLKAR